MECSVESAPHEEARIYSSAYDGGRLLTEFEETGREMAEGEGIDEVPTRSQGVYANTHNPWPRDEEKEAKAAAEVHKRKPCPTRRQGNRWDQYGESSSGESPDQWSDSSAKWVSSAGDDSSWKRASEWEGSQWSSPTKWTLKGSDYDIGKEDSTLPIGSTSKTCEPKGDYTMWQRKDSNQNWRQSTSSGDQWKPRLRQDRDLSSVAGDTSAASAASQRLKSIYEGVGDAVKGPRSDEGYWQRCRML